MDSDGDWKKQEYKNWVRGAKGLEYLQIGLQNDVAKLVLRHRDQVVQNVTSFVPGTTIQCNHCSGDNLLPEHAVQNNCRYKCLQRKSVNCFGSRKANRRVCPNGICSKLYDEIVNSHRFKEPTWKHTDPSTWCSDPSGWSFAKCFQTTPSPGTASSETDAAGLLSIILNDTFFQNEVGCSLAAPNNYFSVAREIRNDLLHSAKMELDDTTLQNYLDTFIAVLQDRMFNDVMSREAVQRLIQLKNSEITINLSEEVKLVQVRKAALLALGQLQEKIEEGVSEIATQVQQAETEITEAKSSALEQLQEKEQEVRTKLETQSHQAVTKIEEKTSFALEEIGKTDIHQRLQQTEKSIQYLTNTIQQMKMEKTSVRQNQARTSPCLQDTSTFSGLSHSDEAYRQLKTNLRKELIDFYRSKHSTFHLSPILDNDDDTPLLEVYVMPDINVITFERAFGGGGEKKTLIHDLRDVFFKDNIRSSEIYLTADAGLGKTSFSKRLALTWCHAKTPNTEHAADSSSGHFISLHQEHAKGANFKDTKYLKEEEIKTMDEMDFLFLVFLRDGSNDCHIIDMVLNQIVQELELKNVSSEDLERILYTEKCLVILDGLDEWSHPENCCRRVDKVIPHRKAKQCTVLTTSRPWKMSDIKASQIDQKLEIAGLSKKSANSLKKRVIRHLCAGKEEKKRVEEFNSSVEKNKITNLVKIPIMLMYLLCLFCENRELGRSLCMLYSNITDMLFCRTVKIHKKIPQLSTICLSEIPLCFKENEFCNQFYTLLIALGKLAFHTLLVETREENTLVFDRSVVGEFLNEECLEFCLKTGILTQSTVRGKLTKQETKVSFAHKTVQEFYASLYTTIDPDSFQEKLLSKCKCVNDILKMSKVLIFVSGFNEKSSSWILSKVSNVVKNDPITHEYRSTLCQSYYSCHRQLKEFQDLCVSCCKEFTCDFQHDLCLQDVFIFESCQEEQYHENLKQLTTRNTQDIRSLYISMYYMYKSPYNSTQKVIDYFMLRDLVNIEKIHYRGTYSDEDILPLLNSSVKSLSLECDDDEDNLPLLNSSVKNLSLENDNSWSHLLFEKVNSLQKLEAININGFKMSHSELTFLLDYIAQRDCMKEIVLRRLSCTDHENDSCTGHSVDLSRHFYLRTLILFNLPVTQVVVNMPSLEGCLLYHLSNPDLVLKFLNCADCKLKVLHCHNLKSSAAIYTLLDTLPMLHHVRIIRLWHINLGTRNLTFSPQVKIEQLMLSHVTMEASTLRELFDFVHKLPQPAVTVDIFHCTISPLEEFQTLKEEIKTLQRYFILVDNDCQFVFATTKD